MEFKYDKKTVETADDFSSLLSRIPCLKLEDRDDISMGDKFDLKG